jgi:hypothetical protein
MGWTVTSAGVADGVPQPGRQPPGVPVAPAPLVGAAPVQARGRAEEHHRRPAGDRVGPGEVDLALRAEGDAEPGRPELEHPGPLPGRVALLALAEAALAVHAAQAAAVAVHLGDVERRAGALGDAEHRGHAAAEGALQQRPHRLGVDGHRPLGPPAGVDRPGQRELREHRQVAALGPGLPEHGQVPCQVAVEVALLGVDRGQQDPHPVPPAGQSGRSWWGMVRSTLAGDPATIV